MPEIKFNDEYPKLCGQRTAELILIRVVNKAHMSRNLVEYDTKKSDDSYYILPDGELIQLFFIGNLGIPFCTMRRYTKEKYDEYESLLGNIFDMVVE